MKNTNDDPFVIDRDTFKSMTENDKLLVLFDISKAQHKKLTNRRLKDSALAASSGFVGGFAAVLAKMAFWNKS